MSVCICYIITDANRNNSKILEMAILVENAYSLNDLRYNLFITNSRKMNKEITEIDEIEYIL